MKQFLPPAAHLLAGLCLALGLAASPLRAAVIYDFNSIDNDYSSGTSDPVLTGAGGLAWNKATNDTRPFSTSTMAPASNYSGPDFFGGFSIDSGNGGFDFVRFETDVTVGGITLRDFVRFTQLVDSGGATNNHEIIFMGATTLSTFDGSSSVTFRANRDPGTAQLVLRSGGQYYVSDQTVALANNFPVKTFNLPALTYSLFAPGADMDYSTAVPSSYDPYITGFDAVGLLFSRTSASQLNLYLGQFTVVAAPVPEPGIAALTLSAGLGLFIRRRRSSR